MESLDFYEFVTILASDFFIVLFLFGQKGGVYAKKWSKNCMKPYDSHNRYIMTRDMSPDYMSVQSDPKHKVNCQL